MEARTIRILGNGGADGLVETQDDNLAYHIGFDSNGVALEDSNENRLDDGRQIPLGMLEIPQGVQLVIDAGAVIKLNRGAHRYR